MLKSNSNLVPLPNRVQIFSSLKEGDRKRFYTDRLPRKTWLRLETTNEVAIRSLVAAMREKDLEGVQARPTNVVVYHIYFQPSDSPLPLYYKFYHPVETNQPPSITAYSTAANLWNAEGVERWFATNNLLPALTNSR